MNIALKSLPNLMTVMRLAVAPVVAILIWTDDVTGGYAPALALFILASISDFLDGWMARRLGIVSKFGAMLDPIADKVLIGVCLLALARVTGDGWLFFLP
ncbi:MAG: CDP-alcohol phosphatidyltransferase family protein, partial [Alphaproteobacteria bacterium]